MEKLQLREKSSGVTVVIVKDLLYRVKIQTKRQAEFLHGPGFSTLQVARQIAEQAAERIWRSEGRCALDYLKVKRRLSEGIIYPDTGEQTLNLLHEPQPLPIETILSTLINELSALPDLLTLVLDAKEEIKCLRLHKPPCTS